MESFIIASHIINEQFFKYIQTNIDCTDYTRLDLRNDKVDFDKNFAIMQIECRKRFQNKLPELLSNTHYLFPKKLSGEQCTHQDVAILHAQLFNESDDVLDMTMGLGVDSYYISKRVNSVTGIEMDNEIASVSAYNYASLATNLTVVNANSVDFINYSDKKYSAVFIDPARRDSIGKRTYGFQDCTPNVIELLPNIAKITNRLVIKASPMLDISLAINELKYVKDIWIVAIKNSCKELLFDLNLSQETDYNAVTIHTINFDSEIQQFSIPLSHTPNNTQSFKNHTLEPGNILLEPNACIMKSGKSEYLAESFNCITKIDVCSHLFVSDHIIDGFPGRQFVIEQVIPFKDKLLKPLKQYKMLNVSTRNFRLSADQLKSRLGVKDGGEKYLFGTTTSEGEMVLILCTKARL